MSTADNASRSHLRPRTVLAVGALATAAGLTALATGTLGGRGTAHATSPVESVQAQYSILRSATPPGLTAVASQQEAQKAAGPIWFQQPGGPAVATAREVPVGIPGLRVWIAATERGEICVLAMRTGDPKIVGPGGTCASGKLGGEGAILEAPTSEADPGYLAAVAQALNSRPRKTLGWRTPAETLNDHLRSCSTPGTAPSGSSLTDGEGFHTLTNKGE